MSALGLPPLRRHIVFLVYLASLVWLLISFLFATAEASVRVEDLPVLLFFIASVCGSYAVLSAVSSRFQTKQDMTSWRDTRERTPNLNFLFFVGTAVLVAIPLWHFWTIGYIPIASALISDDVIAITRIRQMAYSDLPIWMRYASDIAIKAYAPGLIVIACYFRSRWFVPVLILGILYAVALFYRSAPIFVLLPLLILLFLRRSWIAAMSTVVLMATLLVILTAVAAPTIRESLATMVPNQLTKRLSGISSVTDALGKGALTRLKNSNDRPPSLPVEPPPSSRNWRSESALFALFERVLLVPGRVMGQWFSYYADTSNMENGCGYRLLARLKGCEFVAIPPKLYAQFYPENTAVGVKGSLNSASFMVDYANFGFFGLFLGALASAILFLVIGVVYSGHILALPLNVALVFSLMETTFTTALASGSGWIVSMAIFLVFVRMQRNIN